MATTIRFDHTVPAGTGTTRLDKYLAELQDLDLTRSRVQKLIDENLVQVNSEPVNARYKVRPGDRLSVEIPPSAPPALEPERIDLDIVYEDRHLLVVNKPAGLVTHPAAGNRTGTLVHGLLHHLGSLPASDSVERPGIVHRLDKHTSGLLLIAKTDSALSKLQTSMAAREIKRTYLALVCGHLPDDTGTIDAPIGRSTKDRTKMTVTNLQSREAVTEYVVVDSFRSYDKLEIRLQTGRTHQIRVHMSHLGHPVFGDPEYGGREKYVRGMFGPERPLAHKLLRLISRQALHAAGLEFTHPETGQKICCRADIPSDLAETLSVLDAEGR